MPLRRYQRDKFLRGGRLRGTATTMRLLRVMVIEGRIKTTVHVLKENERLDHLAAKFLGDSRDWWILAATSGIGWGLQVPPGTRILIPRNLEQVRQVVG